MSSGYLIRETGGNLRRNLAMTLAAVITMFVSLAAAGGVLIMRQAIHEQAVQWRGGVQVAIFLNASVSPSEVKAVGKLLAEDHPSGTAGAGAGLVKKYFYVDKTEAYHEFKVIFGADPQLVRVMSPKQMPPSYRVVPRQPSDITTIGDQFRGQPGVFRVAYAQQAIQSLENRFHTLSEIAVILAIGVMIGAIALIVNTIQLAIFARRREVAVMKLVGATNWFIRVPFMLEGLVDGVLGALLAFLPIYFARSSIASFVGSESLAPQRLYVPAHDAIVTGLVMLLVGAAVGAIGSAFAVRRFLRV